MLNDECSKGFGDINARNFHQGKPRIIMRASPIAHSRSPLNYINSRSDLQKQNNKAAHRLNVYIQLNLQLF